MPAPQSSSTDEDAAMIREVYEPLRAWYADEARAELRAIHGEFPPSALALQAWGAFKDVTNRFLNDGDDAPQPAQRRRKRHKFGDMTTEMAHLPSTQSSNQLIVVRVESTIAH